MLLSVLLVKCGDGKAEEEHMDVAYLNKRRSLDDLERVQDGLYYIYAPERKRCSKVQTTSIKTLSLIRYMMNERLT